MSKIDWNKVKAYYLTCHSYKMTGEQIFPFSHLQG